jgi:hypothetical protein
VYHVIFYSSWPWNTAGNWGKYPEQALGCTFDSVFMNTSKQETWDSSYYNIILAAWVELNTTTKQTHLILPKEWANVLTWQSHRVTMSAKWQHFWTSKYIIVNHRGRYDMGGIIIVTTGHYCIAYRILATDECQQKMSFSWLGSVAAVNNSYLFDFVRGLFSVHHEEVTQGRQNTVYNMVINCHSGVEVILAFKLIKRTKLSIHTFRT